MVLGSIPRPSRDTYTVQVSRTLAILYTDDSPIWSKEQNYYQN